MPEFVFMLTREDKTVEDASEVYDGVRDLEGLRYVGFKDIGLPFDRLRSLANDIRAGGHEVMLEVVSEREEDELRSAHAALDLGVDYLLGGTHPREVTGILKGSAVRYYPFPGRVVGHPSLLRGSIEGITQSARKLAELDGVHGLDLLAYRYDGDVAALTSSVVSAVNVPVIAAGGVDSEEKISALSDAGVWGFTVGSAVFEGRFGESPREGVETVLSASRSVAS
ncbi:MAG: 4-hydroxythreonine-4-phosphate dehydrogenase [Rubrobacteraceae bacterium]|nr:4-hydroxythreonine-4-phosphate dehydrogenase [Rubrobacteraceae bacterium]